MIGETCKSPQDRVDTELTESAVPHFMDILAIPVSSVDDAEPYIKG